MIVVVEDILELGYLLVLKVWLEVSECKPFEFV